MRLLTLSGALVLTMVAGRDDILAQGGFQCMLPAEAVAGPSACTLRASAGAGTVDFIVRFTDPGPIANQAVDLEASAGGVPPTLRTDNNGLVVGRWSGPAATIATVTLRATRNGVRWTKQINIVPQASAVSATLEPVRPGFVWWYAGEQAPGEVAFEVTPAGACERVRVAFRAFGGGAVTVDTTYAANDNGRCLASTRWQLGPKVGAQTLRAVPVGNPIGRAEVQAGARRKPSIFAGAYAGRQTATFTTLDESGSEPAVVEEEPRTRGFPVLGIDFPLWYTIPHIRLSLGASVEAPVDDYFFGLSVWQLFQGIEQESIGVDLHLVAHIQRQRILTNPTCVDGSSECVIEKNTGFGGVGLLLLFDSSALLTALKSAF